MKKYAVAVFYSGEDAALCLHIIEADTWQQAFNKSPSTWWEVTEQTLDDAQESALSIHKCYINILEI